MTSTIAVISARVVCQAIQLEDGRTIAIELTNPLPQFAIVRREGDDVSILAMREDEETAVAEAQRIAGQLEALSNAGAIH
ncbi:hypothetical protein RRU01S_15_01060 [Agrobacterium rubi TR3 = NBRC 13261]|uniref:Uncharacterized protein n=1 Tax=Agrobacterium rubi TR3 = NBRC 13261 TaxID=1368415 RepID=A0A081CWY5_9HYPH|nr:hypothetical protein [Agrobacterium rubi]MBP1878148.1 hypothetical protein [Agrobacterium rubi]GAK71181.1 hypothetical protein RRU01S_15_01060 [Agrobacterium rubi TR3 = NBRC 13261]